MLPQGLAWMEGEEDGELELWFLDGEGGVYTRRSPMLTTTDESGSEGDSGLPDSGADTGDSSDTGS